MAFESRFGALAGEYQAFRPTWPENVIARVLAAVPAPRAHALDLGAGTGLVALRLLEDFERVTAVEPDARMLEHLAQRPGLERANAHSEDASFDPGSVDLITAGNAFHWMERALVCARAWEWLRPGGALAVFRYDPPHAAHGALEELMAHEYDVLWRAHVHERLRDPDGSRRAVAASAFGPSLERSRLENDLELTLPQLLGFLRSTSYAGGYARSLPDPETYWCALEERIRAVAGSGPFTLDFGIELLIAKRT